MEAGAATGQSPRLAAMGAAADPAARRRRVALRHGRRLDRRPRGLEPAARRRARHPPRVVRAGPDRDQGHEPAARRDHHRHGDGRRRDRAVHGRRADDARAAALGDDRRPVRLGRGRAHLRRRHELERDSGDGGDRRRREDARSGLAERVRLRADRLPRRRRPRRARAHVAPRAARRGSRAGWPPSWRSRPAS